MLRWLRSLLRDLQTVSDPTTRLEALRGVHGADVQEPVEDTAKRGHRVIHEQADRAKTGDADILKLVLQREAEQNRQPGNKVIQIRSVR